MAELLTSAQMRAIEQAAIASGEVTGLELMERAGQGVVEAVFAEWPELAPAAGGAGGAAPGPGRPGESPDGSPAGEFAARNRREGPEHVGKDSGAHKAVVLCGPGNNGGDGFVVARVLAGLGWAVEVFLHGDAEKLPPDARVNYERWLAIGEVAALVTEGDVDRFFAELTRHKDQIVVDALFGTGLARPVDGALASLLHDLDDSLDREVRAYVAVDIPSGLCADSGKVLGRTLRRADLTVTFHRPKLGHVLAEGPYFCGKLVTADIGLDAWAIHWKVDVNPATAKLEDWRTAGRENRRRMPAQLVHGYVSGKRAGHKYSHGHALILAGPSGKGGAARLAARGALRVGAGLVTIGPPHAALAENAAQLTAVMLAEVDDAATLGRMLADKRLNALLLGPGLGLERARDLVPVALEARRATVLDADALTAFSDDPAALFAMLHENCVLTPHAGEFARLFPDIAEALAKPATRGPAYSKVDATRAAAARAGCTVLNKGPDTVIADPSGRASVNSAAYGRAAPWLATAGSGDVLAGFIAGLLARGFAPQQAAATAAWLHVEAARSFGPGLIAEDLPEALPQVFKDLGL